MKEKNPNTLALGCRSELLAPLASPRPLLNMPSVFPSFTGLTTCKPDGLFLMRETGPRPLTPSSEELGTPPGQEVFNPQEAARDERRLRSWRSSPCAVAVSGAALRTLPAASPRVCPGGFRVRPTSRRGGAIGPLLPTLRK